MSKILYHSEVTVHQVLSQIKRHNSNNTPKDFKSVGHALRFCRELSGDGFATASEMQMLLNDETHAIETLKEYILDGLMTIRNSPNYDELIKQHFCPHCNKCSDDCYCHVEFCARCNDDRLVTNTRVNQMVYTYSLKCGHVKVVTDTEVV